MSIGDMTWWSKHVFFPLWEIKDRSHRRRYLDQLESSQWWDRAIIEKSQWQLLQDTVRYAHENVPYYQTQYQSAGFDGNLKSWSDFKKLPLLRKSDIRSSGAELLSSRFSVTELVESRTGGSTGTALTLYFDERCQEIRNAAAMRSDGWAGWDIGMQVAAIWGNPPVADTLKKKLRSLLLERTIYLDTMEINEASVRRFVAQWQATDPKVIFGHSHSIYILSRFLQEMGERSLRPVGIISTSMMLLDPEREVIEQTFQCRVTNRYGCEEVGLIASECEKHAGLHLNLDHLVVEFLRDDGSDAAPGENANIVVTDLINRGMPLIRYTVGDMGVPADRLCPCGRGQPMMERVTGRQADFLKRPDGSLVAGVSLVERTLTAIPGIDQMQLVQDQLQKITVNVVGGPDFESVTSTDALRNELNSVFGESVLIDIRLVDQLDQSANGKYRFAICNV